MPIFENSQFELPPMSQPYRSLLAQVNYHQGERGDQDVSITIKGFTFNNIDANGELIETNHYLVQLFRIPIQFCKLGTAEERSLSILKLLQIAYNVGQLKGVIDEYPAEVVEWLRRNRMLKISAYL